ncbi:EAL domain-containing protein [Solwaraspora sp. WMMD406]|uniref:putative bifunctional diguanylate cyclase/phosphodiesterase n=1 Tax=Solwaraspora sp. WMMD406 TaxID=3016095 RepID=UPI002416838D|nr:GGDEF domain-containing phosphodiesterase [Solwaraspora sp. WMMD406]MDG4767308.1 EAL domain-containing protein [Solwaraspora sp. WMMD406]
MSPDNPDIPAGVAGRRAVRTLVAANRRRRFASTRNRMPGRFVVPGAGGADGIACALPPPAKATLAVPEAFPASPEFRPASSAPSGPPPYHPDGGDARRSRTDPSSPRTDPHWSRRRHRAPSSGLTGVFTAARSAGRGAIGLAGVAATILLACCTVALVGLTLGVADLLPPVVALVGAASIGVSGPTWWLLRIASTAHRRTGDFRACRGAGLVAFATLLGTGTCCVAVFAPADIRADIALSGLVPTLLGYLAGILLLPAAADGSAVRLRRLVDGVSLGVSLTFVGWLLRPVGELPVVALVAGVGAIGVVSVIAVTALSVIRQHRAVLLCGGGAIAAVLGLTASTILFAYAAAPWTWCVAMAPVVVGVTAVACGVGRGTWPVRAAGRTAGGVGGGTAGGGAPRGPLSAYPLLTIPAVVATVAAVYHLVTVGGFDRTSILLGLAVIPTLVIREMMAAADVRAFARRLSAQEAHFRSLVSGGNDLTLIVGDDRRVRWQSPAAARLFGLADADVVGRTFDDLMHPEDAAEVAAALSAVVAGRISATGRTPLVTARLRDGYGRWRDTESTITDQRGAPEVAALVVHVRDVGERLHLERRLHKLGFTDQLTGLANRRELARQIAAARDVAGYPGTLLIIDLHGLSGTPGPHGREPHEVRHTREVSDAVSIEVGRRLRDSVDPDDVVARLGGDEFAVITVGGPMLAYGTGARLIAALREPCQLPGSVVHLRASIGMADVSGGDGVDDVLRRADLARRRARQLGGNRIEWYDSYLEEQLVRRLDLERELPGAAERGELDVVYQPVLDLGDGQPVGVEALLRWRNPALGTVLPAEVLAVARDLSLLTHIGGWLRATACRQVASWAREGHQLWLSVNVSPMELAAPDFAADLASTLAATGIPPHGLIVEVSESLVTEALVAEEQPRIVVALADLRARGIRVALDDFGAGQAPIAQLRRLPLDILKIDRSLVTDAAAGTDPNRPTMEVVVGLGRRLGLELVAEGLETVRQVGQARAAGCRYGQGYALARPAPAERTEAYIAEFQAPSY